MVHTLFVITHTQYVIVRFGDGHCEDRYPMGGGTPKFEV